MSTRALVYAGPASVPGCPEAVVDLLEADPRGLEVRTVGPAGDLPLTDDVLASAVLYAQPGGGTLRSGWRHMRRHRRILRRWVSAGGHYLGFCLGAYLAGATPGLKLLPGDTEQYVAAPGSSIDTEDDTLVEVDWRGRRRTLFFQDGALLVPPAAGHDPEVDVIARYPTGGIAALAAPYGDGRVVAAGPHPEATADWFTDAGLPVHDTRDLGLDLVDAALTDQEPSR